jgi:hypothetical protein
MILNRLPELGERYVREFLSEQDPAELVSHWYPAFEFFLSRVLFQGRSDAQSARVLDRALGVLGARFTRREPFLSDTVLAGLPGLRGELGAVIGAGLVGKARDIEMILSALAFAARLEAFDHNIVRYALAEMENGRAREVFERLQRRHGDGGIHQVGPKVAAFFLRDLACLFNLEGQIPGDFQFCLQPIDTWVEQISVRAGLVPAGVGHARIQEAILTYCREQGISAIRFNQGAWYLGKHALDLIFEGEGRF